MHTNYDACRDSVQSIYQLDLWGVIPKLCHIGDNHLISGLDAVPHDDERTGRRAVVHLSGHSVTLFRIYNPQHSLRIGDCQRRFLDINDILEIA